ncbi:MAG: thiamine diphosphokinase [Elusimicrobia bacterium]|nr:thiamine diphosphokinase [Elusimicrobiota bacterium]
MTKRGGGLLLLNGEMPDPALVRWAAKRCRVILCADGGLRHAMDLGLRPDLVVGDMDSLPRPLPRTQATFLCDFDSDRSDFEKALELCSELRLDPLYVAGAGGGRMDHLMVNLALCEKYGRANRLVLLDRGYGLWLGKGRHALDIPKGSLFSLLASPRAVVTLSGARYPLKRQALSAGSRGLSNVSTGRVRFQVHQGRIWVFLFHWRRYHGRVKRN